MLLDLASTLLALPALLLQYIRILLLTVDLVLTVVARSVRS
jgi:hypothetical protein